MRACRGGTSTIHTQHCGTSVMWRMVHRATLTGVGMTEVELHRQCLRAFRTGAMWRMGIETTPAAAHGGRGRS